MNVPGGITANSINFTADGYTLNGAGPITLTSAGSSSLTTGVINVASGTATINMPINSTTTAFQAVSLSNAGVLALSAPVNVTATEPITFGGPLTTSLGANIIVGPNGTASTVSTLRLLNASVLPATATVAAGRGRHSRYRRQQCDHRPHSSSSIKTPGLLTATTTAWLAPAP